MRKLRSYKYMYLVKHRGHIFAYRTKKEYLRDTPLHPQRSLKEFTKIPSWAKKQKTEREIPKRRPLAMDW